MRLVLDTEEPPPLTAAKQKAYAFWSRSRGVRIGLSVALLVLGLILWTCLSATGWSFLALAVSLALLVETLLRSLSEILTTAGAAVFGIFGSLSLSQLLEPGSEQAPALEPLFTGMTLAGITAALVGIVLGDAMRAEAASYQDWLLAERRAASGSRRQIVIDQDAVVVREETSVTWSLMGIRRTTEVRRCSRLPRTSVEDHGTRAGPNASANANATAAEADG